MCEKAVEVQMGWKPMEGDWFFADEVRCLACQWFCQEYNYPSIYFAMTEDMSCIIPEGSSPTTELKMGRGEFIFKKYMFPTWLPRQDQLQKMVEDKDGCEEYWYNRLIADFNIYCMKIKDPIFSPEQLWLAFVMKEKYNKTWNGEDWK